MYRTHTCNELDESHVGKAVVLSGWVFRKRNFGKLIFIDLRDRYGITQIVSDPDLFGEAHKKMDDLKNEFVARIEGEVRARPEGQENLQIASGKVEVLVSKVSVLSGCEVLPFEISQDTKVSEEIRLKYRFLDLRRERMRQNMVLRHEMARFIRNFFCDNDFLEIETPILIKGTPEGSREYVVPSRLYPGNFYVLPQSPQQLKQLLMVAAFDRYFQVARCFRDEDQRGDRQPEFTQIDMEMSFVEATDIMAINEECFIKLGEKFLPDKKILSVPFPVLTYEKAMNDYGSDKPDIRFDLLLSDISLIAEKCDFGVFNQVEKTGGVVKALKVAGGANFSRKEIDELEDLAKKHKAKGLAYMYFMEDGVKSPIAKFFKKNEIEAISKVTNAKNGDLVLFVADSFKIACESLGAIRLMLGRKLKLIDESLFAYLWVVDFPMFERDGETGALDAMHHPFTLPKNLESEKDLTKVLAHAYDIVLNGNEIGGGSIRIHDKKIQRRVFDLLGLTEADIEQRFGHILNAFNYGVPPHGGIAWGLDRLVMLFAGEENIREVMAFPKDQQARDLLLGSPTPLSGEHLKELNIVLKT